MKENLINDGEKEINGEEKEEKEKEKKMRKIEKKREKERPRVSLHVKRRKRLFHAQGKKFHILWYHQRRIRSDT